MPTSASTPDISTAGGTAATTCPPEPQPTEAPGTVGAKFLFFLKEWGGVATLLIALLYTFPFDAFSKFTDWRDRNLIEARAAIGQLSELNVARLLAVRQFKDDPPSRATVAESFNTRAYNVVVTKRDALSTAKDRLSLGELFVVANAQTAGGLISESIPFYEAAIRTSQKHDLNAYAGFNRAYGYALFSRTASQDIDKGRSAYLEALATLSKKDNFLDPSQYATDLAELGVWELVFGDWKCGTTEMSASVQVWERLKIVNAYYAPTYLKSKIIGLRAPLLKPEARIKVL